MRQAREVLKELREESEEIHDSQGCGIPFRCLLLEEALTRTLLHSVCNSLGMSTRESRSKG